LFASRKKGFAFDRGMFYDVPVFLVRDTLANFLPECKLEIRPGLKTGLFFACLSYNKPMLRLDNVNSKLQAVLAGAITTTQPQATVCYSDQTTGGYTGGKQVTVLNSTTDVDILAAPAAATIRDIDFISLHNRDTASVTVTIKFDISATDSIIITVTLLTLETLEYTHGSGWKVLTATGAIKVPVSAVSPAGASGDVQYNNGAAFGAEAAFNYNTTTNTLAVDNLTIGTGGTVPTAAESDNDTSIASTAFVNANISGAYGCRGNRSKNNAGTPNTQYDITADIVVLRNSSNHVVVRYAPGTITNNVSTAGSTANGRDQAGAFSASSWIYFYWIWNGTTLATLSSAVAPTTGPTLPSGYTHWAYCGAVRFNGSSQLMKVRFRGTWASYDAAAVDAILLNAGSATARTTLDMSALVPPNALMTNVFFIGSNTNAAANQITIEYISGSAYWNPVIAAVTGWGGQCGLVPNESQQIFYLWSATSGSAFINILGYSNPNGGE
jgi:hypothetical protein